jgi:hypothetical protein
MIAVAGIVAMPGIVIGPAEIDFSLYIKFPQEI